jgi:glycosyltransferase involved in cell wall biosynthesis
MRSVDVVHVSGVSGKGIGLALMAGRRPVVTHHGYQAICPTGLAWSPSGRCTAGPIPGPCLACLERGGRGRLEVIAHRVGTRSAAASICVSRDMLARIGLPGRVIYNPVVSPLRSSRKPKDRGDEIVFVGRLVREKGADVLLRAFASVPDAHLTVAGDGPLREELIRLADELEVDARTSFLGDCSAEQLVQLRSSSTVVCVPSLWPEPFGYAAA